MYRVFTRNWWKVNNTGQWPGNLEPDGSARKHTIDHVATEQEAIDICKEWNATHKPGRLSRKCEFTYD